MTRTQKTILALVIGVPVGLLLIAAVLVGAAIRGHEAAMRAGNETVAIKILETIAAEENYYVATHRLRFGTFAELVNESLIDARFKGEAPVVDGYVYQLTINQPAPNAQPMFALTADPQDSSTGRNHFYRDSSSEEIRFNPDRRAGPKDPAWKKGP